jgi:beta-glucosidase
MHNLKLFKPTLLFAAAVLAASACSLPAPKGLSGDGSVNLMGACPAVPDGGVDGASSLIVTGDIENVVTPVACAAVGTNPNAIDKYSQGYTPTADLTAQVQQTLNTMNLADMATQMRGMPYGSSGATQFNDIQRSEDTGSIRGLRYRDASRGMNLGEDMDGAYPNAAVVNNAHVGYSTVFPVSMARGAAFDLDLEYAIGEAIGDEMQAAKQTLLLAPCMNLLRHPLWGRAQETYGEDPFQIGRLASAMVVGVQQHILANAKHYMGYDIEDGRFLNNSQMEDEQTLREIYGRHFRMTVQDAGVASVMASYNEVDATKSTENTHTLKDVLRKDFGFQGFILSDWWAMPGDTTIPDTTTLKNGALLALNAGLDVELPWALYYGQLENLVNSHALTTADLQPSVQRILYQKYRFKVDGLSGNNIGLTPPITVYSNSQISCNSTHIALATKAALESMVLLKNGSGTLPISPSVKKVAVIGAKVPYTTNDSTTARIIDFGTDVRTGDLGSSRAFFDPAAGVGPFAGIQAAAPSGVTVVNGNTADVAADADFVVVMAGLTPQDEGEEYTGAGDRVTLGLDGKQTDSRYQNSQNNLITSVAALGKPMVVVLEGGSVIDMPWLSQVPAVVMAWYPGQTGGTALGDLLWGQVGDVSYNFGGKLPLTWAKQLSDYDTFNGNGTTTFHYYVGYRWFDNKKIAPLFPFGAGLSYTTFEYRKLQLGCSDMTQGAVLPVVVNVANTGTVPGDEVVMVFVSFPSTTVPRRMGGYKELKGFARVSLAAGEEKQVTIPVRLSDLDYFQTDATGTSGSWVVESGPVQIMVGGGSVNLPLTATVNVNGYTVGSNP